MVDHLRANGTAKAWKTVKAADPRLITYSKHLIKPPAHVRAVNHSEQDQGKTVGSGTMIRMGNTQAYQVEAAAEDPGQPMPGRAKAQTMWKMP